MSAVSVIVLVYKSGRYIEQCARSLFGQTLGDLEFIFVDDCSPDDSMDILAMVLDEYPERRSRVRILRNESNCGTAFSRRRGAEAASGDYLIFCDSDDWVEPDMMERLYAEAVLRSSDAVVCGWFRDSVPASTRYDRPGENLKDLILDDMVAGGDLHSLCRFLFRREMYSMGIGFPVHNYGEDLAMLVQLVWNSREVYCVPEPLYHWRTNMVSLTRNLSEQAILRRFEGDCANTRLVEAFIAGKGAQESFSSQLAALKLCSAFDLRPLLRKGERIGEWRNAFPEIKGKVLCNKYITFTHKIEYLMNRYCPPCVIRVVYRLRRRRASS